MNDFELVIIGGGLASARAIKPYREAGGEGRILLVSKDSVLPYHRPPLSKPYLRGEAKARDAFVEPEKFYADNDVELLLEAAATGRRSWARSPRSRRLPSTKPCSSAPKRRGLRDAGLAASASSVA